jgi:hypothetical protein
VNRCTTKRARSVIFSVNITISNCIKISPAVLEKKNVDGRIQLPRYAFIHLVTNCNEQNPA